MDREGNRFKWMPMVALFTILLKRPLLVVPKVPLLVLCILEAVKGNNRLYSKVFIREVRVRTHTREGSLRISLIKDRAEI